MDKVVKLELVLNLLREKARRANEIAGQFVGVDNNANNYFHGLHNGYARAVELLEENSDKPI